MKSGTSCIKEQFRLTMKGDQQSLLTRNDFRITKLFLGSSLVASTDHAVAHTLQNTCTGRVSFSC
jgi:hypothetical protein